MNGKQPARQSFRGFNSIRCFASCLVEFVRFTLCSADSVLKVYRVNSSVRFNPCAWQTLKPLPVCYRFPKEHMDNVMKCFENNKPAASFVARHGCCRLNCICLVSLFTIIESTVRHFKLTKVFPFKKSRVCDPYWSYK